MTKPKRPSPEEIESIMVPKIVEALYPVLIPVEQQDVKIQKRNRDKVTKLAVKIWQVIEEEF